MSEVQFDAQGVVPTQSSQVTGKPASKRKNARAQAYKTGRNSWSARVRRQGADIFLSGFTTQASIEQELNERVAA